MCIYLWVVECLGVQSSVYPLRPPLRHEAVLATKCIPAVSGIHLRLEQGRKAGVETADTRLMEQKRLMCSMPRPDPPPLSSMYTVL